MMMPRIAPARGLVPVRALAATVATIAFALAGSLGAGAQQGPAKPGGPTPAPAAAGPQAQPAAPGQPPAQGQAPAQGQPKLGLTPWTKLCNKVGTAEAPKTICLIIKEARLENGQPVAGAAVIEPQDDPRRILRVTVPLGMMIQYGTRIIIDQDPPIEHPYVTCVRTGCVSDYEANADMLGRLKKGQSLVLQAVNAQQQPISLSLPLSDFAKAYDGPPIDQTALEDQQKKMQEELKRRGQTELGKMGGPNGGAGK